jgi:DNA (cytosine-5)-methyltransferase 1
MRRVPNWPERINNEMLMSELIDFKIARLSSGEAPRLLDMFAGCGGLSLGFKTAGFSIQAAIESDSLAASSHAANFFRSVDGDRPTPHSEPRDITKTEPEQLVTAFGLGNPELAFDVLVGGPPCQAYARVGRAKLREIAEHPEAFKVDARADLYLRYLHYVSVLKPLAILLENVPDIMNFGGRVIPEEICDTLDEMGYEAKYTIANCAFFGVPQMRERVFLIAYHKSLHARIEFPRPTHYLDLPTGYKGTRDVALKNMRPAKGEERFVHPFPATTDLAPAVSAREALEDLPVWSRDQLKALRRGARRFTELVPYRSLATISTYAQLMRTWPGFENSTGGVYDHVIRYLPRDGDIFRHMKNGDEYPAAHAVAVRLFEKRAANLGLKPGSRERDELYRKMVPPYRLGSFPNRWWKLRDDAPARTLMAHLGKDSYSHIHYDSDQARCISVREAARLQSFPDGFLFKGTMNPAFRQIGNAVPPLMAQAIAETMKRTIESAVTARTIQTERLPYYASSTGVANSILVSGSNGSSSGSTERLSGLTASGNPSSRSKISLAKGRKSATTRR